jgi:hypothetical protein
MWSFLPDTPTPTAASSSEGALPLLRDATASAGRSAALAPVLDVRVRYFGAPRYVGSFPELLSWRASVQANESAYTYLQAGEQIGRSLTYRELEVAARSLAAALSAQLQPGDRALLLYAPGIDFVIALFACFHAGVIAVPAPMPDATKPARCLGCARSWMTHARVCV